MTSDAILSQPVSMFHRANDASSDLLTEWRWLLGGRARLHGWSAAGDLFYADDQGAIWRLDTGAGTSEPIVDNPTTFAQLIADPAVADELLLLPVVADFEATRGPLRADQCLGFTTLPVLGGTYTADNRYALAITEHARFTGDVHRQLHKLPEGAQVRVRIVP